MKKAWYVGSEADREKITKWEPKHQPAPTLAPRAEFAAVLREIGTVVQGEHPILVSILAAEDRFIDAPVGVPVHFVKDSRKCHREIIMEIIQKLA